MVRCAGWSGSPAARTGSNAPAAELAASWVAIELLVMRLTALVSRSRSWSSCPASPTSSLSTDRTTTSSCALAASSLVVMRRSVIWFCSTMPSTNTTAADMANVEIVTRNCRECRHSSPNAVPLRRPNAATRRDSASSALPSAVRRCFIRRLWWAGLVAHTAHGQHDLGVFRVAFDLRAQALDVDVHQAGVGRVAVAPHLLEQHLAGEDLARLAGQRHEEVELQRGQRDGLAGPGHLVAGHVDGQV